MGRSSRQKINKEVLDVKHTLDQVELRNSLRACHPAATKYTFFSSTQEYSQGCLYGVEGVLCMGMGAGCYAWGRGVQCYAWGDRG